MALFMKTPILITVLFLNLYFSPVIADSQDMSKQQAINIAQQQHPGRVLSVKQKGDHYKIKILDNAGNMRVIRVNKSSNRKMPGGGH